MNKNYVVINGAVVELTGEQVDRIEQLGVYKPKKNPFGRTELKQIFYHANELGDIRAMTEEYTGLDTDYYKVGNYCTDKVLMKQLSLHEILNRLLLRFSYENGWNEELWDNVHMSKYTITYDVEGKNFDVDCWNYSKSNGLVHFKDEETAKRAIKEIIKPFMKEYPEFVW